MNNSEIKQALTQKHQELSQRLSAVQKDLQKDHSHDWSEQAQERENDEVLEAIATQTAAELTQIEGALKKLEQDDYGICTSCGESIAAERLIALPEALTCINCA